VTQDNTKAISRKGCTSEIAPFDSAQGTISSL
jgi:hypothetical protein